MRPRQTISSTQAIFFMFTSAYGGILFLHSHVFLTTGRATWLAEGLGGALLIMPALVMLYLANFSPGSTLFEIIEDSAGKLIAWICGGTFILISIVVSALMLKIFEGLVHNFILQNTPGWVPTTAILLLAIVIARSGIETVGRLSVVIVVVFVLVFFMALGFGFAGQFDFHSILPFFDRDPVGFFDGVNLVAGGFGEVLLFIMIMAAALPKPAKSYKPVAWGLFMAVVVIPMLVTLVFEGLIGPDNAARIYFAGVSASLVIQVGKFIQGLEVFILIAYETATVMKISINLLSSKEVLAQLCGNKYPDLWLPLIAVAVMTIYILSGSTNAAFLYYVDVARYIIPPYVILTIGITSLFHFIKKRRAAS